MTRSVRRCTSRCPTLDAPVLVVMLTGWIDASGAAAAADGDRAGRAGGCDRWPRSTATRSSTTAPGGRRWSCATASTPARVARHRAAGRPRRRRPRRADCSAARSPTRSGAGSPTSVVDLAVELGVRKMVGLGAYPVRHAAHPRPAPVEQRRRRPRWSPALPYLKNSVDVPAGMGAVLEHALRRQGRPRRSASGRRCRTTSRHAATPRATLALLDGLREVAGVARRRCGHRAARPSSSASASTSSSPATTSTERWSASSKQLYDQAQQETDLLGSRRPARRGDELAAEFERFLRDQGV